MVTSMGKARSATPTTPRNSRAAVSVLVPVAVAVIVALGISSEDSGLHSSEVRWSPAAVEFEYRVPSRFRGHDIVVSLRFRDGLADLEDQIYEEAESRGVTFEEEETFVRRVWQGATSAILQHMNSLFLQVHSHP